MPYNNPIKILKKNIFKKNDLVILIPTFKSAQITINTITLIGERNKNIGYDIIVVDNEGQDYGEIQKVFPEINFIVLERNVGSSGSQHIALKVAMEYCYKYYCLSDNDAIPLDKDLFSSQIEYLETHNDCGAVLPYRVGRSQGEVKNAEFHYFMINQRVAEKVGLPNPDYFLSFDDIDYSTRIYQADLYIFRIEKKYYHPYTKHSSLFNPSIYFRTRSLLIFLFNKNIFTKFKYGYTLYFFQYVGFHLFHSLTLWDGSIIKTITKALLDFLKPNLTLVHPINKFAFKPIDEEHGLSDFQLEKKRLFLYFGKKFVNNENGVSNYFQLVRIGD
jgi:GT2 family glycosyltransferase